MSKAILLSIKPKWVAKILNGEKTIEIRKQQPKCNLPIDVYIYCTKDNKQHLYPVLLLDNSNQVSKKEYREAKIDNRTNYLNGKVVAKFTLRKVEEIKVIEDNDYYENDYDYYYEAETCISEENPLWGDSDKKSLEKLSCLNTEELDEYLQAKTGYAYHIEDLVIFDKPKELSEFYTLNLPNPKHIKFANWKANYYWALGDFLNKCPGNMMCDEVVRRFNKSISIQKAPQNFVFVESEE